MNTRKTIGLRIASMRGFKRLSQEQLGGMVGVSKQTISGWEHGYRSPDSDNIIALCRTFGCSADYLLGMTDDPGNFYRGSAS